MFRLLRGLTLESNYQTLSKNLSSWSIQSNHRLESLCGLINRINAVRQRAPKDMIP